MKTIKPVIISTRDISGGAARAAYRLHQGLHHIGVDARMLVQFKDSDNSTVVAPSQKMDALFVDLRPKIDNAPLKFYRRRPSIPYAVQWLPTCIHRRLRQLDPDVINLHWICGGYLSIEAIGALVKPVIWSLHDMWPFTGGCHYDQDCGRYTAACGACPQLDSHSERDLSRWIWRRKARAWRSLDLTVVALSRWLAACARESALFKDCRVEIIPNGLDLERFKPVDKRRARDVLNLPLDKHLVLFSAMRATLDQRKGFDLLKSALQHLRTLVSRDALDVVVIGGSEPSSPVDVGFHAHYLGTLSDEIAVSLVCAAVDVFVAPSRQDNLPNTVMEALACGTPCVAFNIGGMPDMIDHQRTGFLATPFAVEDLAGGIHWVLTNTERYNFLTENARHKAVCEFDHKLQAQRYLALYQEILKWR